jgi:hypothetical protein
MISIISSISGIHSRLALTKVMTYNSQGFRQRVIPDVQQNICSSNRRETLKGILFSCALTMHQLMNRECLQKRLNPQKPKEHRNHFIAQPRPSVK